jgi:hypothetical protein
MRITTEKGFVGMTAQAYAYDLSVRAGDDLQLCVSTDSPFFRVEFYRYGAELEHIAALDTPRLVGLYLPVGPGNEDWGWPRYRVPVPADARSGVYIAKLIEIDGDGAEQAPGGDLLTRLDGNAMVVVRPAAGSRSGAIMYKLSAATYQAYNEAGGASFYSRAAWWRGSDGAGFKVTLRRTGCGVGSIVMMGEAQDAHHPESRRQSFAHWDAPFVRWLEVNGYACDYCTDFDLDEDQSVLDGYALLLSVGHDEYWSTGMRERILEFSARGGNVAYFSGNLDGYRIQRADNGSAIFTSKGYPGAHGYEEHDTDAWHLMDPRDAPTKVATRNGGGWWDGRRTADPFVVQHAGHWAFAGTGLANGDEFGAESRVVGYECDSTLFRTERGVKIAVFPDGRANDFAILASASLSPGWVARGNAQATLGLFTNVSGGLTFSASTTDWPMCVPTDSVVEQITRNVLDRLSLPSARLVGPISQAEDMGFAPATEGEVSAIYADIGRLARDHEAEELTFDWTASGCDITGDKDGPVIWIRPLPGAVLVTVALTVRRGDAVVAFGSKTVHATSKADGLRTAICAVIRNVAMPSEPAAPLFSPVENPRERIRDVSQSRLEWLRGRAQQLASLATELEAVWEEDGSMAGTAVSPDIMRRDRQRWDSAAEPTVSEGVR